MSQVAKYDLEEVKGLLRLKEYNILPRRSVFKVVDFFRCAGCSKSNEEAEQYIVDNILELDQRDFATRVLQWEIVADVYGIENLDGENWYVKFYIETDDCEKHVVGISFHPLEKNLLLADQRLLKASL